MSTKDIQNDVVIIGGIHHNTLGVVRSFGEKGLSKRNIYVCITGRNEPNIISKSKYVSVKNIIYVKSYSEIPSYLVELAKDQKRRVIICCSDGAAEVIMNSCDLLKEWYELPSIKKDIRDLMEKQKQDEIAVKSGLMVPQSSVISTKDNVVWNKFPCITKPYKSAVGGGKYDIHTSNDKSELEKALRETKSEYVQVQEFIKKKIEFQLIGCSLDAGEKIIVPGFTNIIRQPKNTNTGYLLYSPIDQLSFDFEAAYRFIRNIGYSGLFSLEFIRDESEIDYFLEINLRNDGNAYCVKTAGVNLPYIWYHYCLYHQMPIDEKTQIEKPVYFMPDLADIRMGMDSVGFGKWVKEFYTAKSHAVFNYKDMKPFLFQTRCFIINYIKRRLRIS